MALFLGSMIAVAETDTPIAQMRQTLNSLLKLLADESLKAPDQQAERRVKISQVLSQRFAYKDMAREALGRHG